VQLEAQLARVSQPYPVNPGAHAHVPRWHSPLPEQLPGQDAGPSTDVK
jgi:hypothetical protein